MVELIKKNENGLNTKVCFEVQSKDAVIVDFIKFISGDNNKWHVNNVTTDALIKRFILSEAYNSKDIKQYIIDNFTDDMKVIDEIENMSIDKKEITISLPTSTYATTRGVKSSTSMKRNNFYPLVVSVDGKDLSGCLWEFELFGSKAVNVACDALLNGNIPKPDNSLFDFYLVEKLSKELCNIEKQQEQ